MEKLSIKKIVDFRGKSDKAKKSFVKALKEGKRKEDSESGGDYWVSCLSAISNSYKADDATPIGEKKDELEDKYRKTAYLRTKTMYRRNIDVLSKYEGFDFRKWRPAGDINFLKKHKADSVLTIKGFTVLATPHHVFTFKLKEREEVGAIWFIAKLDGFKKSELGMFCDLLYRYLKTHFSKKYVLNSKYCIAVDVFKNREVKYSQLARGEIQVVFDSTLDELKKLL
jgi:hypothetical protein